MDFGKSMPCAGDIFQFALPPLVRGVPLCVPLCKFFRTFVSDKCSILELNQFKFFDIEIQMISYTCLFFQESVLKGQMPVVGTVEVRLKCLFALHQ